MPLLHLWQEHFGFISDEAVLSIAEKLGLQPINILELVTFYPMFRQKSPGKTHIRICRTLSCAMAGSFELMVREFIIPFRSAPTEIAASSSWNAWPAAIPRQCAWWANSCTKTWM